MPRYITVLFFLLLLAPPFSTAAEEFPMPLTLFRDDFFITDTSLPNIHPRIPDSRRGDIIVSVQEKDGLLRTASYNVTPKGRWQRLVRLDFINTTGRDLTGLPAGFPKDPRDGEENDLRIGEYVLKPTVPPVRKAGSEEWRTYFRWRHVHGDYYYVIMYRGMRYGRASIIYEELVKERDGHDVRPFLGESLENPGPLDFNSVFGGQDIVMYPNLGTEIEYPIMHLTPVYSEKDLPEDFPEGLVRWIP